MNSKEIKNKFLTFFEENDHQRIKGASLLPKGDPTLLFINSGMAAMKSYFTGESTPPSKRLANVQPCIRTNDIDDVGDMHHLTFFQMLGSWSIGDYYKQEAVELAYELLVDGFKLPSDHLYASVYEGNSTLGIPYDEDSHKAWLSVGMPESRIVAFGDDNFWGPAGSFGPCGPCTEVFLDTKHGTDPDSSYEVTKDFDTKGRYMEIWNAGVFMQYYKDENGILTPLKMKSVDTGAGLERLAMAMNNVSSVYETDIYTDINKVIYSSVKPELSADDIRHTRIIADHVRAASFIMSEGVFPGTNKQQYIPRRLVRRAISSAYVLEANDLKFGSLVDCIVQNEKSDYPLLADNQAAIERAFSLEQESFIKVLRNSHKAMIKTIQTNGSQISGPDAFKVTSSYGLPIDILSSLAQKEGASIDLTGYNLAVEEHRQVSRKPQ